MTIGYYVRLERMDWSIFLDYVRDRIVGRLPCGIILIDYNLGYWMVYLYGVYEISVYD